LALQSPEDVRVSGVGFRDKYLVGSAKLISSGEVDISGLSDMSYPDAKKELMRLPGIGEKVADCVILFSLGKRSAFPVDTWVKKVMEHFYLKKDTGLSDIRRFSEDYFKELAGYAQQYLFYYARENKIG
jgi:N-glycosylase/DNA lyase